jgi:DnaJ family protein B protein 4
MAEPSFYDILGVGEKSSHDEIKKAFRKLSLKHHPDRNNNSPESVKNFQTIGEAWETLGDSSKRKQYDMTRRLGGDFPIPGMFTTNMNQPGFPGMNMDDVFAQMFGGISPDMHFTNAPHFPGMQMPPGFGGPGGPSIRVFRGGVEVEPNFDFSGKGSTKPTAITKKITIDMSSVINGDKVPLEFDRWVLEQGVKRIETVKIYVDIPSGVDNNEIIVIEDAGNVLHDRCIGDVKVIITIENESLFERSGLDLIWKKEISLKDALCGFSFELTHLNGKSYAIRNSSGTIISPGYTKSIPGMGIKRDNHCGKLIILFSISFPKTLDKECIEKLSMLL